jgi:hypothetical protein
MPSPADIPGAAAADERCAFQAFVIQPQRAALLVVAVGAVAFEALKETGGSEHGGDNADTGKTEAG